MTPISLLHPCVTTLVNTNSLSKKNQTLTKIYFAVTFKMRAPEHDIFNRNEVRPFRYTHNLFPSW